MSLPIVLRDEAQKEFDEAIDWYDVQRPGLAFQFKAEIQKVFDRIAVFPKIHAIVLGDIRKAVVRRFPYCVFYRPHADRIEVLAVFTPIAIHPPGNHGCSKAIVGRRAIVCAQATIT
jgi:plasmid stabilization system protein ParE